MNTARTANTRGTAYRLGNGLKRLYSRFNAFEINVARRAQKAIPAVGFALTRIVFLAIKLALVASVLLVSVHVIALLLVALAVWILRQVFGSDGSGSSDSDSFKFNPYDPSTPEYWARQKGPDFHKDFF